MAVLGSVFLIAAAVISVFCLWAASLQTAMATQVEILNNRISITPTSMFLLGAAAMFFLLVGVWLTFFATKRRYQSHRERRTLEKREREQAAELAAAQAKLEQLSKQVTPQQPVVNPGGATEQSLERSDLHVTQQLPTRNGPHQGPDGGTPRQL